LTPALAADVTPIMKLLAVVDTFIGRCEERCNQRTWR
jgi:hypothetical protein